MRKRFLSLLLALCMVLALMPAMPVRVNADDHTDHCICGASHTIIGNHTDSEKYSGTWQEWNGTDSLPSNSGYYYLTDDVTISGMWEPANSTVLCLNGHTITGTYENANGFIRLDEGATFTLTDCKQTGKILKDSTNGPCFWISGGTFNMYGRSIEHADGVTGDGVFITSDSNQNKGTFNMYGGNITKNTCGVYNDIGNFNMYGGAITGNKTTNKAGGVFNGGSSTITISGGEIFGNEASFYGGGVYNNGTATIRDNMK